MIWMVVQISMRRLLHNRVEMLLTFVVPIAFFSIFALIFGGVGADTAPQIKVLAIDLAKTPQSQAAVQQLRRSPGLRFVGLQADDGPADLPRVPHLGEAEARDQVRRGQVTVAILLERGPQGITARLLSDSSDPIAGQLVLAMVSHAVAAGQQSGIAAGQRVRFQSDDRQTFADDDRLPVPPDQAPPGQAQSFDASAQSYAPAVTLEDVLRGDNAKPVVSMYAAGIAVMFLLFGASGGGGALLEEQENGTLDRLFATQLTMDQLLMGKWTFLTVLGVLQTTLMFVWGQLVFGIDLVGHLDGFLAMTVVTTGAAASFGLLLATICRTRGQLNGLSVIVVLTMSALGGSMVPRYIMSENLQRVGWWTFNAWALDGYNNVFWREQPLSELWPQMSVLMVSGFAFLMVARCLSVRWETH